MKRTEFLKLSCTGCMLTAAGLIGAATLLEGCSPKAGGIVKATVKDKLITVLLSRLSGRKTAVIRGTGMEYDIAVHKVGNGSIWEAFLLRCTHFSNPLLVAGDHFDCSLHGSQFGLNGEVIKGPASQPLQRLPCSEERDLLVIHV